MNLLSTVCEKLTCHVRFTELAQLRPKFLKRANVLLRVFSLALTFLTVPILSYGQSTLAPGEIVFTGYSADFPGTASTDGGQFSFLLLRDIEPNTTIFFTDFGWDANAGAFHTIAVTNDAVITWTTLIGLSCGTEVVITASSTTSAAADIGTVVSGGITFNSSGDQISAYQGDFTAPDFISALQAEAGAYSASSPTNDRGSQLPNGLVQGTSAFVIMPEIDNMVYSGSLTNDTAENIRAAVYNNANWLTHNGTGFTLSNISWNISECLGNVDTDPPVVQSISLVGSPIATAGSVAYEVSFDEPALNVSTDDFTLTTTGGATGIISAINGSGDTYTLTVSALGGVGTIRPDLNPGTDIVDASANSGVLTFTTGDEHTVNILPPPTGGSTLAPGELVFTGYNADFPGTGSVDGGQFSFLLLRDVEPNTTIFFTDFGWDANAGAFHTVAITNDAVVTWTTSTGLSCGTEVVITATSTTSSTANVGTVLSGGFTFNSSGDQISAYQGGFSSPDFISALQAEAGAYSTTSPTNDRGSQLPDGLVEGTSAFVIMPEIDNMVYSGGLTNGTAENIRAAVYDNANWSTDNSAAQSLSTINWTITECLGNVDDTPPEITVADIIVNNDVGVCGAIIANFGASATDDSGTADLTFDIAEGTQFAVGTTTVTVTAVDPNGNSSQATFDVTVNDVENPLISLNGNALVFHDAYTAYIDAGANTTDNCIAAVSENSNVDINAPGSYTVTLTATDPAGNQASVNRTVIVRDITSPVVSLQNGAASLDENGLAIIDLQTLVTASSDDSGEVNTEPNVTSFDCDDIGDNTGFVWIEDGNGNGPAISQNGLIGYWKFSGANALKDLTGNWDDIQIIGNASITNEALDVDPGGFARTTGYNGTSNIVSKTLISYVAIQDLTVRSGAAMSIDGVTNDNFDAIVYAERQPFRWMNGSSGFSRTQDLNPGFAETQADLLVQMAITYQVSGGQVTITVYRNGVEIGSYTDPDDTFWTPNNVEILFGARHTSPSQIGGIDARITKALLYDRALTAQEIADMNGAVTVSVTDDLAPVLTLNGDATINLNIGDAYTELGANANDNCTDPAVTTGGDFVDVNVVGTYVLTYNATDASGNAATEITRTVNVLDNAGPVITVNDINIDSEPGECGANIFDYGASAADPSGIADFNFSIPEGSFFDPGTTEVTAFASDNNGNVSQVTFNVTVNDIEAPVLIARGITVELDENGFAELPPLNPEVILFQGTFDDDTPALNTNSLVNWNVTGGNVDVYFANQFGSPFNDNALELAGSVNGAIESKETFTLEPGNYLFSFEARGFNGDAAIGIDIGTVLNTSFTNFTGARQTVVFEFTVTQTTTATIRLNEFGGGDAFSGTLLDNLLLQKLADSILITATDNCGIETITPSVTGFGCNELGTQQVTLTVRDEAGNEASETVDVEVVDNLAPTFATRESFILLLDQNGQASVTPADYNLGTVLDNCGVDRIEFDRTDFGCGDVGFHVINVTAFDASGNATTTQADVEVRDEIAPEFLTRESFIIFVDQNGEARLSPSDYNTGTIITNCNLDRIELSQELWGCGDVGFHVINVTAFDGNGLATTTQADVEVRDEIAPTFLTRESFIIFVDQNGEARLSPSDYNTGTITTNCDLDRVELSQELWGCGDVGFHVINVTAFDGNGLSTTTQADVEVRDEITPVITLIGDAVVEIELGSPYFEEGADVLDNCNAPLVIGGGVDTNTVGAYIVTYNAVDENGNPATEVIRTINVIQTDTEGPIITANDITAFTIGDRCSAVVDSFGVTATDDSGVADITFSLDQGASFETGTTSVTATATDNFGNVSIATFNVTVIDNVAPTFNPNDVTVELDENGDAELIVPAAPQVIFSDNFEAETPDLSVNDLSNWNVTLGNVDVFEAAVFNLPTTTTSVELAGNVNGAIETKNAFTLEPGNYRLRLDYRGTTGEAAIGIDIGNVLGASITEFTGEFFEPAEFDFVVTQTTTATIRFNEFGGGQGIFGTLIDNVRLLRQPDTGIVSNVYDNCQVTSITASRTDFTCADIGQQTVTVTVADAAGNESSADITVNVVDNSAPRVLGRESFILLLDQNGQASINPSDLNPDNLEDNCGITNIEIDRTDFGCGDVGFHVINITVTDAAGNVGVGQADVEVRDEIAPTFLTRESFIIFVDENGEARLSPSDYNTGTIITNCNLDRVELSQELWGCGDVGFHVINVTAFDGNGLATTTQADVEVRDEIAPTFLTRESFIIFVDENGEARLSPSDYNTGTIITNCNLDRIELSQELWGCGDVGFHVINVTAFDGNGLSTTTQADVEVRDEIAPIFLTRESFILDLDENGQATLTPDQYNTGTIQTNCDLDRVEFDRTDFGCGDLGFTIINVTAFDGNGLATTTQADVEVRDAIGPIARARDITVTLDEAGNATITPEDINDGSSDNCGIESLSLDRTVFDCDDIGEQNIVTLTVIDSNGISAQAQATVTVSDVIAPVVEVQDIILELDANGQANLTGLSAQTQMFYDGFSADDPALRKTELVNWNVIVGDVDVFFPNQFGLPFSTSALDVAGDVNGAIESKQSFLFEPGDYRLTFTVLGNNDDARLELEIGNLVGTTFTEFIGGTIETRSVDFTVTSTTSATIVFSEFGDEPFFSGTTIDDIELSRLGEGLVTFADDACGVASITASQTSFNCDDIGAQQVTVTATDANGNTSSATATVTVIDNIAPTVVAQDIELVLGANGEVSLDAADLDGGTSDNCDFTLSVNQSSFNCASLGENTVILTATDGSGNSASAEATVTVVDNVGPVVNGVTVDLALDENGTASISLADVEGAISDNCGVATISIEATDFTCDDLGANSVNVTAVDANGNTTTGTITVNVIDIIPPTVVTEDIALTLDENGQAVITADDVLILSEDEIDTGNECTVSAAEHHAVWLSNYVRKSGDDDDDDDDDDDGWAQKKSGNDLGNHKWWKGRGKGKGKGKGDDDDDDDRHHRPENTRFVFDADGGSLSKNTDGTATVTGTIRSTANAHDQWVVTLNLENGRTWDEWSALGRSYKDEAGLAHRRFEDWTYFEMAAGSKLTGAGINAGDEIALSHAPADYRYGFQLGDAANSKNGNYGLSGWFFYTNRKGHVVQGDFNLDVTDCTPNTPPSEVMVTNDNCSLGDITLGQTVFTCDDIGENVVEITVADQSGNETTAFATVTISDNIAPVAVAQDITVSLGADGTVTIDAMDIDGGSTDNCAIVSYSLSQATFDCDDVVEQGHSKGRGRGHNYGDDDDDNDPGKGKAYGHKKGKGQKVVFTVTDAAGNSDSAEAYVTVVDDLAPEISADPVTIVVYGRKRQYLTKYDVAPAVTDNCEVKSVHFPRTRFDRSDVGLQTVMVSANDHHGNTGSGLLNVNVVDITNLGTRVEICYNGQTKRVGKGSVQNWIRKGATLGSCDTDLSMTVGAPSLNEALGGELASEPLIELGAFPNPTQGETVIRFSSDVAGPASVGVISPNGVRLTSLFDGDIEANVNTEVRYNTSQLPSGMYIIRMVTAGKVKNLKLMVKK